MSYNYFFDPETLIDKCEIVNNKIMETETPEKLDEESNIENDAIIEIDSDTNSTTYQSEFEKIAVKSEVKLQVLKEVPHDDKENISSSFNEFGKRPRGRPKEYKPKQLKLKKEMEKERSTSPEPPTAPKTFNISLGFLNFKNKTSRDKSKKSHNSTKSDITTSNSKNSKKRGKSNQKSSPENVSTTNDNDLSDVSFTKGRKHNADSNSTKSNENDNSSVEPVKKKRGRPIATVKIKDKKYPGQKGRPLSNNVIEIAPRRRRGRPFSNNKPIIKKKHDRPGRPSLGLKKPKKYDRPGRPRGPPKPIKIPRKRGPKPNPNSPPKSSKIPGRGRGRPSFASLKKLIENEMQIKPESDVEENVSSSSSSTIKNESESESEYEKSNESENEKSSESENESNISEKSDNLIENIEKKPEVEENNTLLVNNPRTFKGETYIEDIKNINEIETISLTSTDTDSDYDNKESPNNEVEGYFTITDNKFKIGAQLDYMFHGTKNILQKHYI